MTETNISPLSYPFLQEDIDYTATIRRELDNCLTETDRGIGTRVAGKVQDIYDLSDRLHQDAISKVSARVVPQALGVPALRGAMRGCC